MPGVSSTWLVALTWSLCAPSVAHLDWKQPPIRTGPTSAEALPWADTLESALARAQAEKKLVLATVVAVSDDHWVSGYAGAQQFWEHSEPPIFGDEVASAIDEGLRKERVMMATWFTDADVAALVARYFVPVRVRCRPWDFDLDRPTDPLSPLGTTLDAVGAPALVVAKPDGKLVHALGRIGVFRPEIARATLRTALREAGVKNVLPAPAEAPTVPDEARAFAREYGIDLSAWLGGATLAPLAETGTTELDLSRQPIERTLSRAADVLLSLQRPDGGFGNPALDIREGSGAGSEWDYVVARTALVSDALLRLRAELPARKAELGQAARAGIELVGRFADAPQPWIWQATYALHLQIALLRSDLESDKPKARERAGKLVTALVGMQQDGGWSYCASPRTHSFNTALVLLEFAELVRLGVEVPTAPVEKAQNFLASLRNPKDARDYWYAQAMHFEPRAATCRSALCELALLESGDAGAAARLAPAVASFFDGERDARSVTKIYESFLSPKSLQDAYHYYFGHYYAARALARLPSAAARSWATQQIGILLRQVEVDGSFVDAQAQGKSYSTAMAVLALLEARRYTR